MKHALTDTKSAEYRMTHSLTLAFSVLGAMLLLFGLLMWRVYRAIQTADEPAPAVVSFQPAFWGFDSIYFTLLACLTFWIPPFFIWKIWESFAGLELRVLLFLPLAFLPGIFPFVYLRLQWSYWQHDKNCFLVFYREENRFVYGTDDASISYNTADVVQLIRHVTTRTKFNFAYTVVNLCDGSALLFTSVLCDRFDQLLPNTKCEVVRSWYPRLPDDQ
ncbi:hypothetical protein [Hymenobacter agri]